MPFASSNINENEEPINTLQSGRMQGRNDPRPGYISITGDSDDTTQLISRRDRNDEAGRLDSEESLPLSTSQFIFKRVDTISTGIFLTACSVWFIHRVEMNPGFVSYVFIFYMICRLLSLSFHL